MMALKDCSCFAWREVMVRRLASVIRGSPSSRCCLLIHIANGAVGDVVGDFAGGGDWLDFYGRS